MLAETTFIDQTPVGSIILRPDFGATNIKDSFITIVTFITTALLLLILIVHAILPRPGKKKKQNLYRKVYATSTRFYGRNKVIHPSTDTVYFLKTI